LKEAYRLQMKYLAIQMLKQEALALKITYIHILGQMVEVVEIQVHQLKRGLK
jgi:hypothetical protein